MIIQCPNYLTIRCFYALQSYNFVCEFNASEFHENFPHIGQKNLISSEIGNTTLELLTYENSIFEIPLLVDIAIRLKGKERAGCRDLIDNLIKSTHSKSHNFKITSKNYKEPILFYSLIDMSVMLKISDSPVLYRIDLGSCFLFLDENEALCAAGFREVIFQNE
jgi:hypothetical protein